MTQDEIIRMARETGFNVHPRKNTISSKECLCDETLNELLERFAALVAAHEREACAKVCDDIQEVWLGEPVDTRPGYYCAAAIRARGEK